MLYSCSYWILPVHWEAEGTYSEDIHITAVGRHRIDMGARGGLPRELAIEVTSTPLIPTFRG